MDVLIGVLFIVLMLSAVVTVLTAHVEYWLRLSPSRFGPHHRMLFVRRVLGPEHADLAGVLVSEGWETRDTVDGLLAMRLRHRVPGVLPWSLARATRQSTGAWVVEVGVWGSMVWAYSLLSAISLLFVLVGMFRGLSASTIATTLLVVVTGIAVNIIGVRLVSRDADGLQGRLHALEGRVHGSTRSA